MTDEQQERHFDKLEDQMHAERHADPEGCERCRDVIRGDGGL